LYFFFLQTVTGIGATRFESYTNAINEIMERISEIATNYSSVDDCCGYRNQILDKFCAVQNATELKTCSDRFGYRNCKTCLQCCEATSNLPATCTNPLTQFQEPSRTDLCPAPPRLSYDDIINGVNGTLDSHLVYVDEHLIEQANDLNPEVFIRRVLGGFVMTYDEPNFWSCGGFPNEDSAPFVQGRVEEQFLQCTEVNNSSEYFSLNVTELGLTDLDFLESQENCPARYEGGSGGNIDAGSLVDGTSANYFQQVSCIEAEEAGAQNSLPVYTPNRPTQPKIISATVYYNNNVSCITSLYTAESL
jgi:hypothetical protein